MKPWVPHTHQLMYQPVRSDCNVVVQAKAHGFARLRVMAGGADHCCRTVQLALGDLDRHLAQSDLLKAGQSPRGGKKQLTETGA